MLSFLRGVCEQINRTTTANSCIWAVAMVLTSGRFDALDPLGGYLAPRELGRPGCLVALVRDLPPREILYLDVGRLVHSFILFREGGLLFILDAYMGRYGASVRGVGEGFAGDVVRLEHAEHEGGRLSGVLARLNKKLFRGGDPPGSLSLPVEYAYVRVWRFRYTGPEVVLEGEGG